MKARSFLIAIATFLIAGLAFMACQKDVLTPNPALNAVITGSSTYGITPVMITGNNPGGNVTCEEAATNYGLTGGYDYSTGKIDYQNGAFDFTTSNFGPINVTTDGMYVTWSYTPPAGYCLEMAVIVKGGDAANVYYYSYTHALTGDAGLHAPTNHGGQIAGLSNLTFCWNLVLCEAENPPPCENWLIETAYAGNTTGPIVKGKGGNSAWWYAFDINGPAVQNIYAAQTTLVGTATYDAMLGTITLNLTNGWMLEEGNTEAVKWYSFNKLPTTGRPTPGLAPNKGTSLVIDTNGNRYYVIHLEAAICMDNML